MLRPIGWERGFFYTRFYRAPANSLLAEFFSGFPNTCINRRGASTMKVLAADGIAPAGIEMLKKEFEVVVKDTLPAE
jgi:hypothetical protein